MTGEGAEARTGAVGSRSSGPSLAVAFTLSGVAGLVYELAWSRYLAFLVGHSAYAQVLVLAVYLGGTAVGSLLVAKRSRTLVRPLRGYALVELGLAGFGLLFHLLYLAGEGVLYGAILPALGEGTGSGLAVWGVAVLLILPQAVLLGATFPLMVAGVVRRRPTAPGRSVAEVYLLNTLGGALGVLLGGFALVPALGLPGTAAAAGALNLAAAALTLRVARASAEPGPVAAHEPSEEEDRGRAGSLLPLLLAATFVSSGASFLYEVGWIRMLALVLGSATHSFELMLSAFLLGLGMGSLLVRRAIDLSRSPVRLLGVVQVAMGAAALLTLPVYARTYPAMAWLVDALPRSDAGYLLFNLSRYGVALLVMLPATLLAGMTLPLITGTLLRARSGERAIGQAYGANTLGSVAGAMVGGLVLLPTLGLEGLLALGAALDLAVGVVLLAVAARPRRRVGTALAGAASAAVLVAGVTMIVRLDEVTLTSGVFRAGTLPEPGSREVLFYKDGATASVGAYSTANGQVVLTTNGKADASITVRWLRYAAGLPVPRGPIQGRDEATQVLAPLILLAHRPDARRAAVVGQGSGMSGQVLLGSPALESLATVEIEPAMVRGSEAFMPANRRSFEDPRSRFVLDDARSVLAREGEPLDLVFSEPSNPWVSGVASLFTVQFYERVRAHLGEEGVFGQWFHLYEMEDGLLLSVLAAVHRSFPYWSAWMVGTADVLVVAGNTPLRQPDWSVLELPAIRNDLGLAPSLSPGELESLLLFDQRSMGPLVERWPANTDYRPRLDVGADQARYMGNAAVGLYSFGDDQIDLHRTLVGEPLLPSAADSLGIIEMAPITRRALAAWLRTPAASRGLPPEPDWNVMLAGRTAFEGMLGKGAPVGDWRGWLGGFTQVERVVHGRVTGWADTAFYGKVDRFLATADAPPEVRASVDLLAAVRGLELERAARAADRAGVTALGAPLLPPALLLDLAVPAYLAAGRAGAARAAFDALAPRTGRPQGHARELLLDALIRRAEEGAGTAPGDYPRAPEL